MAVNVARFKRRILAEQDRLLADRARLAERSDGNGSRIAEGGDHTMANPGDAGAELFEREKEEALSENIDELLAQVEVALGKIESGTYGTCDKCRGTITEARLDALPYVSLCLACQERMERQ